MHILDDYLLDVGDCRVIEVIGHGHHGCARKTPSEASRAHLAVELGEGFVLHFLELWKNVGIFLEELVHGVVLFLHLLLIIERVEYQPVVLNVEDLFLGPIAEEFEVRHKIEIWPPE